MKFSRRPRSAQPEREEKEREASASSETPETQSFLGEPPLKVRQAPDSEAAYQRRASAGAETTPTTGSPSTSREMRVAQTGTPRTKFFVPSMGSMTHWRPEDSGTPPSSSP